MSSNWYQKRLAGGAPAAPAQPAAAPAQAPAYPQPQVQPQQAPQGNTNGFYDVLGGKPGATSKGGIATKTEVAACPGCGSNNYFSRSNAGNAKPRCYDCGYPVIQFASDLGEGGSMQAVGGG